MTRNTIISLLGISVVALTLSACGTHPADRAISGAALGAGAGAAIGAATGGSVGTGAAIGAAAGGILGAVTSPHDVYLGEPPWRYHDHHHQQGHHHHYTNGFFEQY
jgi:hypothetical protein